MEKFFLKIAKFFLDLGYPGIFITMFLESSLVPFPSEMVLIPAGYSSAMSELNIFFVIFIATFGDTLGACFGYLLGSIFGRDLVIKYGKYFFLNKTNFYKVENLLKKDGNKIIFFGKFVPVVRLYIYIIAGTFKMRFKKFLFFTTLSCFLYIGFLTTLGYLYRDHEKLIKFYFIRFKYAIVTLVLLYLFYKIKIFFKIKKKSKK